MQEFQKLITPGHIAGHRAKAALAPFYAPACVSYTAGIVLALCAFTGVGGHAFTMPTWFDRAFTADVAVYQKAADARAVAAQKAAEDKVEAERKAQPSPAAPISRTSNATQPAAPVVASAPPATPSVPENYTPSPALQEAIQTIGLMTHASTMAAFAQQDEAIASAMTKLVNADRAISDKASAGFAACAKQSRDFNEKAIADAPDHILRGEAQQAFFDVNRTCISDLLASFAMKE